MEEGTDEDNIRNESDDKLDLMMEETEAKPAEHQGDNVDTQDYDTRSEAGSSAEDMTSFTDSGSGTYQCWINVNYNRSSV